jgi:short-subunit dehydrogenase
VSDISPSRRPSRTVELTGGRALITGAHTPEGAATARLLAGAGMRVALLGADRAALAALARQVDGAAWGVDGRPGTVARVAVEVTGEWGVPDVVVTGPGRTWTAPLAATDPGEVGDRVGAEVTATLELLAATVPRLVGKGRGQVVLVGIAPGLSPGTAGKPGAALQATTMGALTGLSAGLRAELDGTGVKVSLVQVAAAARPRPALATRPSRRPEPVPVDPEAVAAGVLDALRQGRAEVVVPPWLGFAPRLQALAPHAWAALTGGSRPA